METIVLDHPLVDHKISLLRSRETPSATFRALVSELSAFLVYEATKNLRVENAEIATPVATTTGKILMKNPRPLIVTIPRAGLGMLGEFQRMMPSAEVGFLGMARNEETLQPEIYMDKIPRDLTGRQIYAIDPMLATGGSMLATLAELTDRGATDITVSDIIAAPEGVDALKTFAKANPDVSLRLVVAALDEKLNERGYIVPGLGDAGDRLYGKID